jgi:DNA-binding transcriptional LysR family regulator
MNWNDVRFILAVAEHGTLHDAAQALSVSHTTVWRRIQTLEKNIGAQLFISDRQGYRLTDIGKEVLQHAKTVSDNMDAIDRVINGQGTELKGLIRLTAPFQATNTLLPSLLKEFQSMYPQIRFEILLANAELDLEKREADIAIRGTQNVPGNLIGRCLGKTMWSLYVSDELYTGKLLSIDEIKTLPMIGYQNFNTQAGRWYADTFKDVPKVVTCSELDNGRSFADVGMGVALLPSGVDNNLNEIYRLPEALGSELWLLTHKEMRTSAKIKAFWDFLLKKITEHEQIRQSVNKDSS